MKNITSLAALLLVTVIPVTFGCQTNSEKVPSHESEVAKKDTINSKLMQNEYLSDWEKYKEETNAKISENEKTIEEFKAKIANSKNKTKATYDDKIEKLEQKNKEMKRRLNEYEAEGKDQWNSFKEEFNHDMNEFGNALKDLTVNNVKN